MAATESSLWVRRSDGSENGLLALIRADVAHARRASDNRARSVPVSLLAVVLYRIGAWLLQSGQRDLGRLVQSLCQILTGAELDVRSHIGPGLFLQHPAGVVVGPGVVAGADLYLYGSTVLGYRKTQTDRGYPAIGDGVTVYAKASVLGPIAVGDGAIIGPHALVMHDVPPAAVVYGPRSEPRTEALATP